MNALLSGPTLGGEPLFPPRTKLLGIEESEGLATVDFSRELLTAHPGGSLSELKTVYGLVNTLAENFPYIRGVRILVEGESVETLKGHVDLRGALAPDYSYSPPLREVGELTTEKVIKEIQVMERD